MVLVIVS